MRIYSRLFEVYREAEITSIDSQIIINCKNGTYTPLDVVAAQFKSLVKQGNASEDYQIVRRYLVNIFGEATIKDLEEI